MTMTMAMTMTMTMTMTMIMIMIIIDTYKAQYPLYILLMEFELYTKCKEEQC